MSRIIYVGNSEFAVGPLKYLFDSNHEVSLVISQNDKVRSRGKTSPTPVKQYAIDNDLQVFTTDNINDECSVSEIDKINPDFIVVVSFGQFIGKELMDKYKDRILNVHASILPKYRGASPIQTALLNGEKETGVSIMLIDEGMDTGDVLKICKLSLRDDHTSIKLSEELSDLGGKCLVDVLDSFDDYYKNRQKQNNSNSSYAGFISKEMGHIDFNLTGEEIMNKFRAFYAWPKLYFIYGEDNVKVHEMKVLPRIENYENGEIIKANSEGIFVNCDDSCLVFTEIQFPNKKKMLVSDYLKGNEINNIVLK